MCTIENYNDLCKSLLEASSVVMVPLEQSCGRGACGSTIVRAHKKIGRAAPHGAGVRGSAQHPHVAPRPTRFGDLRQQRPQGRQAVHATRHRVAWRGRARPAGGHRTPTGGTARTPLASARGLLAATRPQATQARQSHNLLLFGVLWAQSDDFYPCRGRYAACGRARAAPGEGEAERLASKAQK
jgi:hypothetical protein